jgi:methylmalonyl-CoA/ethylmalonyl-CoA epimerase
MQVNKIDHIGIAVNNLEESNLLFKKLLGSEPYKTEEVKEEEVKVSFFKTAETKIELLQALNDDSAIAKFISKKGAGIHHIAFEVDNIHSAMKELQDLGFLLLSDTPKRGADNKLICFLHPKSSNGVLVELCQEIKESL